MIGIVHGGRRYPRVESRIVSWELGTSSLMAGSDASAAAPTSTARAAGIASPVPSAVGGATAVGVGGLGAGAGAAIGVAGAGVLAAGAYVTTRRGSGAYVAARRGSDRSSESPGSKDSHVSPGNSKDSSGSSSNNPMDDLDGAIEAGNWGTSRCDCGHPSVEGTYIPPPRRGCLRAVSTSRRNHRSTRLY